MLGRTFGYAVWLTAALLFGNAALAEQTFTGVVELVSDGDTFRLKTDSGPIKIRLYGIDAPESKQNCVVGGVTTPCGKQAGEFLMRRIIGRVLTCKAVGGRSYDRWVATCQRGKTDINAEVARAGWAVAYRKYTQRYIWDEQSARQSRAGIWAGSMETPQCFRHPGATGCPCPIESCTLQ